MEKVDNAIILAAGMSSRFAPLSYETPKGLLEVRGEVLVERQIRQLRQAGVEQVVLVTGYRAEEFAYLKEKYGVTLVHNPEYDTRNNNGSIYAAREYLGNSYICSSDNYFVENPFEDQVEGSYYSAVYAPGETAEWCIQTDAEGWMQNVTVGGRDSWVMLGHVFWSKQFSQTFLQILEREYHRPETVGKLWETIYIDHIRELPMKMRKYPAGAIFEFDTLDELRQFDASYQQNTRSAILRRAAAQLGCQESQLSGFAPVLDEATGSAAGASFLLGQQRYCWNYAEKKLSLCPEG